MQFISTRDPKIKVSIDDAITQGLAPDGGLFVPETFPHFDFNDFLSIDDYSVFGHKLLKPFFNDSILKEKLLTVCQNAFNFNVPLHFIDKNTYLLELFHGPTISFKDFGARFLAEVLCQLSLHETRTVLVATSGDTGSAVASSFHKKPNIRVVILFPLGGITERQQHQITCWNDNVLVAAVKGSFDDCQKLVKQAFQSPAWQHYHPTSANSINIARLLPQVIYYAYSSMRFYQQQQKPINFVVPSGNLGNVTAAYWAKRIGFPIHYIAVACNANQVLPNYLSSGQFEPKPSIRTLANAMDVGNPSNFERLTHLFPSHADFIKNVSAISVSDDEIRETIEWVYQTHQLVICPHTATAYFFRRHLPKTDPWIVVATADPCKFETIIEPLLKISLPIPNQLEWMLLQTQHFSIIEPKLDALQAMISSSTELQ